MKSRKRDSRDFKVPPELKCDAQTCFPNHVAAREHAAFSYKSDQQMRPLFEHVTDTSGD